MRVKESDGANLKLIDMGLATRPFGQLAIWFAKPNMIPKAHAELHCCRSAP